MITELHSAIQNAPSRKERLQSLTRVESVKLKVERAALLFRGAPTAILVSVLNAFIAVAVAWSVAPAGVLLGWAGAVLALAIIRSALWIRTRLARASARAMTRFANLHVFFMALNGALWGALAPIFAMHGLLGQAFLPFVLAGMAAAAVVSAGASWRAVLSFNVPALAPLSVAYLLAGEGVAVAGVVALYAIATVYLAVVMQRMVDRSILLHTRNATLFDALQAQVDRAMDAEQRFRALVESSQDVTLIFSPAGKVTYASPSVRKIFGVEPDAILGATTKSLVHEDDLAQFRAVGERTLATIGEAVHLPHVCMRAPGGDFVTLGGRLTNMLYVPGVEGFVFNGGALKEERHNRLHAVR